MDIQLNGLNQFIYLLGNNKGHDKSEMSKEVEEAMEIHDKYMKSDEIIKGYELERERMYINSKMDLAKEKGKEESIEIGKLNAERESVIKLIDLFYEDADTNFVYECTHEQLNKAYLLIKEKLDYEIFKQNIQQ